MPNLTVVEQMKAIQIKIDELAVKVEALCDNFYSARKNNQLDDTKTYVSCIEKLSAEAYLTHAQLSFCRKRAIREAQQMDSFIFAKLQEKLDKYFSLINMLEVDIEYADDPVHVLRGCVIRRPLDAASVVMFIANQLNYIHVDISCCDAFEETFLKLAGIQEKPKSPCAFGDEDLEIVDNTQLEEKHLAKNSLFFQLHLTHPESIQKLAEFSKKNDIEFHDYTHTLSEENKKSGMKLIRIDAEGAKHNLLSPVKTYLQNNPRLLKNYLNICRDKLKERLKNNVDDKHLKRQIFEIENRIKTLNASLYSWGGLFTVRRVAALAAGTAALTLATVTLSQRLK